jgi:hypothetical protein
MRKPIRITTPYPTLDEVAKIFGITPKRQKELAEMMDRIYAKQSRKRSKTEKVKRKGVSSKKAGRSRSSAS